MRMTWEDQSGRIQGDRGRQGAPLREGPRDSIATVGGAKALHCLGIITKGGPEEILDYLAGQLFPRWLEQPAYR